jgi:apolipoprotein D and lipocalin family protein
MKFFMVIFPVLGMLFSGCRNSEKMALAVNDFDAARYCGIWYEIARLPNLFQRGMHHAFAEYTAMQDGSIKVVNRAFDAEGKLRSVTGIAKVVSPAGQGELKVSFFKPFWSAYRVIYLTPDYSIAAVCGKSPDLLWILARRKKLSPTELAPVVGFLKQRGFAVEKLAISQ